MKHIIVIDYSMLKHIATAAVKKFQDQNAAFGHLNCIAERMSEILYSLKTLHKPDIWAFAMDSKPYWRDEDMYAFYKAATQFLSFEDQQYWKAYGCLFKDDNGKLKKCTKKEAEPILEANIPAWDIGFDVIAESFPLPKYKGHRKPIDYSWLDCEPAQYHEFMAKLPMLYSKLLNGTVVSVQGAEADDIAAIISHRANENGNKCTLISGDSDWAQLSAYYKDTEFVNPYRDQKFTFEDREEIIEKTLAKIIGGDAGDGIKGCAHNTAWGPVGETKALDIVKAKEWGKVILPEYLAFNKRMVRLHPDSIPLEIVLKIEAALKVPNRSEREDLSWQDLNLTAAKMNELKMDAKAGELFKTFTEKE